jgi:hypothetical protein
MIETDDLRLAAQFLLDRYPQSVLQQFPGFVRQDCTFEVLPVLASQFRALPHADPRKPAAEAPAISAMGPNLQSREK